MLFLSSILIIVLIIFSLSIFKKSASKTTFKKGLISIGLFIALLYVYYFIIGIITAIPLAYLSKNISNGTDTGLWAYSIIAGIIFAPILSLITTIKLLKNKN